MTIQTEQVVMVAILVGAYLLFSRKPKKITTGLQMVYPKPAPTAQADWVYSDITGSYNPTTGKFMRIPAWELAAEQVLRWYQGGNVTLGDVIFVRTQFAQDPNAMFDKLFPGFQLILPTLRRSDYIDDTGFPSMALLKAAWPRILRAHSDDRRESYDPVPDWDADEASD